MDQLTHKSVTNNYSRVMRHCFDIVVKIVDTVIQLLLNSRMMEHYYDIVVKIMDQLTHKIVTKVPEGCDTIMILW